MPLFNFKIFIVIISIFHSFLGSFLLHGWKKLKKKHPFLISLVMASCSALGHSRLRPPLYVSGNTLLLGVLRTLLRIKTYWKRPLPWADRVHLSDPGSLDISCMRYQGFCFNAKSALWGHCGGDRLWHDSKVEYLILKDCGRSLSARRCAYLAPVNSSERGWPPLTCLNFRSLPIMKTDCGPTYEPYAYTIDQIRTKFHSDSWFTSLFTSCTHSLNVKCNMFLESQWQSSFMFRSGIGSNEHITYS
jgi:hypothetical protein